MNVKVDAEKAWDGESCLGAIEAVDNFDMGNLGRKGGILAYSAE